MRSFYIAFESRKKKLPIPQTLSAELEADSKIADKQEALKALEKTQTLSANSLESIFSLSWSQYILLTRIESEQERSFYEIEATQERWSVRELQRQINSGLFERLALSKNKAAVKQLSSKGQLIEKPEDILKDPYTLDFLGLDE